MTNKKVEIKRQSEAPIPTKYGTFNMIAYSTDPNEKMPHIALVNPETDFSKTVNIRVHSECMTGDLFGSYRCECGEQLDTAMEYVYKNGGVIIYLRQEGRGIGIINKLHAYTKQDEGYDTAEANKILGFGYDDRTYEDAICILKDLGISKVNLITNNPDKIKGLDIDSSIEVESRIAIQIKAREENESYLKTKKEFFGHEISLNNLY